MLRWLKRLFAGKKPGKRVCVLVNARQGKGLVLGEGFVPDKDMLDAIRDSGLFNGAKSIHANRSTEPIEDRPSKTTIAVWSMVYSDKLDFSTIDISVVELEP